MNDHGAVPLAPGLQRVRTIGAALHSMLSRRDSPLAAAATVFLLAAAVSAGVVWKLAQVEIEAMRARASLEAADHSNALEQSIARSLSATYALAGLVREGNGTIRDFAAVARQMLPFYPGAQSLQLAPQGVVRHIVPLDGNEAAIGHDLLRDPARTKAAFVARDTGKLTLDGPFPLVQGGLGAVGRLPVLLDGNDGPVFWGFTSVLIRFPEALAAARFNELSEQGLAYQLSRADTAAGRVQVIAATSSAALIDPVRGSVHVPNATWTLEVAPVAGWRPDFYRLSFGAALGLFLSALLGFAAKLTIELRTHKRGLEALVERRTAEYRSSEARFRSLTEMSSDFYWESDAEHRLTQRGSADKIVSSVSVFQQGAQIGHRRWDVPHLSPDEAGWRAHREVLDAHLPFRDFELSRPGTDGSERHISISGDPVFDAAGRFQGYRGVGRDITNRKRTNERIAQYIEQLRTAFVSTVDMAMVISEMRDPYTVGHERRVAHLAAAIGAELGFDADRQEGLRIAGSLHDVGKITIPAEILSKPGRLSAIEMQMVKGHPQASYDVLKGVQFPWPVAEVALQHHERIDCSGYPQGLKGGAILLEARIMAVADVVEAMSSHRPYRPALGIDAALAEIERGTLYDAAVVDACLKLFREKAYAIPA